MFTILSILRDCKFSPSEMTGIQSCIEDTSMLTCFLAFPTVHYHQPFVLDNRTIAGIRPHATGVRNPRANAIVERLHQTIGNSLRTRLRD
jgi:transposase InsO family protein